MTTFKCPHCGYTNVSLRRTCDNSHLALNVPEPEPSPEINGLEIARRRRFIDHVADFLFYAGYSSPDIRFDIDGFLVDLQKMKPDLPELAAAGQFISRKARHFDVTDIQVELPDLPDIDLSIALSYLANLELSLPDYHHALEFLATLRLPNIDLWAIGELLPHINLSAVDLPALAELLPRIDLAAVDLPALGELLSNIDLPAVDPGILGDLLSSVDPTAVDLSVLADMVSGVDWSALAEGLSEIDITALLDLLEGLDLG